MLKGVEDQMGRNRILFFLSGFMGGGVETVANILLQHLDWKKFETFLVLYGSRCDYPVPPQDVPITLLHKKGFYDLPRLVWRLAKYYEQAKPSIVLSLANYANLVAILARRLSCTKPKVLLSEHTHTSSSLRHEGASGWLKSKLIPFLYPKSDGIICVSQGIADDLVIHFGIPPEKVKVIYNPMDVTYISAQAKDSVDHPWFANKEKPVIIAMGHLITRKGYLYLVKAFARVVAKHPCRLVIMGEGEERQALEGLAKQLRIEKEVDFLGFQTNPFKYLAQADIFVLSSLWEGFALVIVEAMACGIPVISTRCPSGPDEIIMDGVNGRLVPVADEASLADAMLQLLNDADFAAKLARAGRKRAEDFEVSKIVKQYEEILLSA